MIEELGKFLAAILLITAGVMLKKGLFPNTKNIGKLWLLLIILGCLDILTEIISLIIRN